MQTPFSRAESPSGWPIERPSRTQQRVVHERFRVLRQIGLGGMGAVYEVFDERRQLRLAMKELGEIDAEAVNGFKIEFRDFQHLHHPNLVSLDEFFTDGRSWYFTMEMLQGRDFLSYVRHPAPNTLNEADTTVVDDVGTPSRVSFPPVPHVAGSEDYVYPGRLNVEVLRPCLQQLVSGLRHLHLAGRIHRDLKSSNVMVTTAGRVVVLDFGVGIAWRTRRSSVAGTPLYMAPEQFQRIGTPATDWYAVGVLLYQALTGRDPFHGSVGEMRAQKKLLPRNPLEYVPDADETLVSLIMGLLTPDPYHRLGRRAILEWIENQEVKTTGLKSLFPEKQARPLFVGRKEYLATLRDHFDAVRRRSGPTLVYVQGESGIGKSALVEEFVGRLESVREATVLRAQVLQEEVVPYKSMDGLVDALAEMLIDVGYKKVGELVPSDFSVVADSFPVLRRVPGMYELPRVEIADPTEKRARMFASLKETFRRVAASRPLILTVDDLQWSDADSIHLWREFVRGENAPNCLILATIRTEQTASLPPPQSQAGSQRASVLEKGVRRSSRTSLDRTSALDFLPALPEPAAYLWVQRMSMEEAAHYLDARRYSEGIVSISRTPDELLAEAKGHPFFIDELLRHGDGGITEEITLDGLISRRIAALPEDERRFLQAVCLSAKPLPRNTIAKAIGLSHGDGLRAAKALRDSHLIKVGRDPGPDGDDWVMPFHYRVKNACVSVRDAEGWADVHRALAVELEAQGSTDIEHLYFEWRDAGHEEQAARYAERVADEAERELAFDRAAEFLRECLLHGRRDGDARDEIVSRLANALQSAGRGKPAADVLLDAAQRFAQPRRRHEFRSRAAALLLRTGYIDEGVEQIGKLLRRFDLRIPPSQSEAFARLLAYRARLWLRGMKWVVRPEQECDPGDLERLDTLSAAAVGLGDVDHVRSYGFSALFVLGALDVGEPGRISLAFAIEAITHSAQGDHARSDALLRDARSVAERYELTEPLGFVKTAAALTSFFRGDWREARSAATAARDHLKEFNPGALWEQTLATQVLLWSLAELGEFSELCALGDVVWRKAVNAHDRRAELAAITGMPGLSFLCANEVEPLAKKIELAKHTWSKRDVHLQHLNIALSEVNIALFRGDSHTAKRVAEEIALRLKGSVPLRVQPNRVALLDATWRADVAVYRTSPSVELRQRILHAATSLERETLPYARALAQHARVSVNEPASFGVSAPSQQAAAALQDVGLFARRLALLGHADPKDLAHAGAKNPSALRRVLSP
jgi:serine/threonine protein kinase